MRLLFLVALGVLAIGFGWLCAHMIAKLHRKFLKKLSEPYVKYEGTSQPFINNAEDKSLAPWLTVIVICFFFPILFYLITSNPDMLKVTGWITMIIIIKEFIFPTGH